MAPVLKSDTEAQLAAKLGEFYADPLGFVMFAYPWGEPTLADGSPNPLRDWKGPEPWQRRLLTQLGEHIRENIERKALGLEPLVWRSARASGHGVGKSAVVAWLHHFFMSTRQDHRGTCTANTQRQLEDKTWPELAKWHKLLINKHWFQWTASSYYFAQYPEAERKNYMLTAATVSEDNTEAFAGLHNEGKSISLILDEASGIHEKIWEVALGATTDGEVFFFAFGNPTLATGAFADCFDKHLALFNIEHIDSRHVSHTNKQAIRDMLALLGGDEEDDRFKVRVRGMFPSQSFNGFISLDVVNDAINRDLEYDPGAALIMAVDVARYGDDETVIGWRQGRDARSRRSLYFQGLSTTRITRIVKELADKEKPDAIVIESTGPGAGVIDQLRDDGYRVIEVHPGSPSSEPLWYFNKRAELWSKMRDWLVTQGCIYEDPILLKQLTSILYTLDRHEQRTKLEPKEDMKKRTGLSSPDRADTLALTFAVHIARRDSNLTRVTNLQDGNKAISEYDVHAH